MMDTVEGRHMLANLRFYLDDIIVLTLFTPLLYSFMKFFHLPQKQEPGHELLFISPQKTDGLFGDKPLSGHFTSGNLGEEFAKSNLEAMILWATQSGTSENFARVLSRRWQRSTGLKVIADDIANYEPHSLASVPKGKVIVFILATYGEGDPPDSAVELDAYLRNLQKSNVAGSTEMRNLQYLVFGLGSSKYQHYNQFSREFDEMLTGIGAKRLGHVGFRDEATRSNRTWDEWAESAVQLLAEMFGRSVNTTEEDLDADVEIVDLPPERLPAAGPTHKSPLRSSRGHTRWHSARISDSRDLNEAGRVSKTRVDTERIYLDVQLDVSEAEPPLTYEAGDHVAILPQNHDQVVHTLCQLFGWDEGKAHAPISMVLRDGKTQSDVEFDLIASPTTRAAILRHHLDICGPLTVETVRLLARFAPINAAKEVLASLTGGDDDPAWTTQVVAEHRTIGQIMEIATAGTTDKWPEALFLHLIQSLPRLRPRYFSISSSPRVAGQQISITVGVIATALSAGRVFYGLASNYLLALHEHSRAVENGTRERPFGDSRPTYHIDDHHAPSPSPTTLIHVRKSGFKLPDDVSRPVIMVGAGSGIAPFLGFTQERQMLSKRGSRPGRTVLFFGCRSKTTDFLYQGKWQEAEKDGFFEVDVAESRGEKERLYVQDKIRMRIGEILHLLLDENAVLYICGSVNMAKGVKDVIAGGIQRLRGTGTEVQSDLACLKASKQLQEDVWE